MRVENIKGEKIERNKKYKVSYMKKIKQTRFLWF